PTLTEGVVSSPISAERLGTQPQFLNIDAAIRPGNSGGLAADDKGRLIGVPADLMPTQDLVGVAASEMIPIDLAKPLIQKAEHNQPYTSPWTIDLPSSAKITSLR